MIRPIHEVANPLELVRTEISDVSSITLEVRDAVKTNDELDDDFFSASVDVVVQKALDNIGMSLTADDVT